jgi:hypothetical protein
MRKAFASLDETERAEGTCPTPEAIWDAVHAAVPPENAHEIVHHLAICPSCAADWRTAMHTAERPAATTAPAPARIHWTGFAAAAAVILAAALLVVFRPGMLPGSSDVYRAPEGETILSLVPEDEVLPRDAAVLRWTSVGDDARYTVEVNTLDLTPVARARDLTATEYRVPSEAMTDLPSGETVVWTVEAGLVDGRRITSKAFHNRIE